MSIFTQLYATLVKGEAGGRNLIGITMNVTGRVIKVQKFLRLFIA